MPKQVVIIGVGALGSHFLLFARNLPVTFKVIDFDRVEAKNVLSQFHTKMGKGKNKAAAIQASMRGLYDIKIDAVPHRLTADNVDQLLGGADLLVDCVDNGATRVLIQKYAKANDIPCVHGALSAGGEFGLVQWTERFVIDFEGGEGQATCEDGEHLPFISKVAVGLAIVVQKWLASGVMDSLSFTPGGSTLLTRA